jgi:hypothetical protein
VPLEFLDLPSGFDQPQPSAAVLAARQNFAIVTEALLSNHHICWCMNHARESNHLENTAERMRAVCPLNTCISSPLLQEKILALLSSQQQT